MKRGFVYAAGGDHPLSAAVAGERISLPAPKPPWIVVDHGIESILVTHWPGKLWAVEIVGADPEAQKDLVPGVWYTRAFAVNVLHELPLSRLFGEHGEPVCRIIETVRRLQRNEAEALAAADRPDAHEAYSRAWNRWLSNREAAKSPSTGDGSAVLEVSGDPSQGGSPVNGGFGVIHSELEKRARRIVGDRAFVTDDEGEESFTPTWLRALSSLLHAAMALGRPDLVSEPDRPTLLAAWRRVFGAEPQD